MKNLKFRLILVGLFLITTQAAVVAQDATQKNLEKIRRFEIGGQGTMMFEGDFDPSDVVFSRAGLLDGVRKEYRYESGFGGRFTVNLNRNLSVESEYNFIPGLKTVKELFAAGLPLRYPYSGGSKSQFLAGAKYGIRNKKFGLFAKVRPGAIHFEGYPVIENKFVALPPGGGPPLDILLVVGEAPATFFNLDVGAVVEFYPKKRQILRFDIGDTMIRYGAQTPKEINPTFWRHNLQMSLGYGFRF